MLTGLIFLRLVSEACQMSTSAWVSIKCHWWAFTLQAVTLLEITTQLVDDSYRLGHGFSYILSHFECNGALI